MVVVVVQELQAVMDLEVVAEETTDLEVMEEGIMDLEATVEETTDLEATVEEIMDPEEMEAAMDLVVGANMDLVVVGATMDLEVMEVVMGQVVMEAIMDLEVTAEVTTDQVVVVIPEGEEGEDKAALARVEGMMTAMAEVTTTQETAMAQGTTTRTFSLIRVPLNFYNYFEMFNSNQRLNVLFLCRYKYI